MQATPKTADILGVSAIILNDLRRNRNKDYNFSWKDALQTARDSGSTLQYAHCRLCSLINNSNEAVAKQCDPQVLLEPEAIDVVLKLAQFEQVLLRCNQTLEASHLVVYLSQLAVASNRACNVLNVKSSSSHLASQRLLVFNSCRTVLNEGMSILGLRPLERM